MSVSATIVLTSRLLDCREMRPLTVVEEASAVAETARTMDDRAVALVVALVVVDQAAVCRDKASNKAMVNVLLAIIRIKNTTILPATKEKCRWDAKG